MTKLADHPPAYCASCYSAGSEKEYVDFEAAYDGPVIPGSPVNQPVDDLVICRPCLEEAFALIDPEGLHRTIADLKAQIEADKREQERQRKAIRGLQAALDSGGVKPKKQKLEGEALEKARARMAKARAAKREKVKV